jgi:glycine/D-amino acid oxidase-like deaminating enzyme
MTFQHDIIIVGAGLAGLRAAVECTDQANVAVVSKVLPTRSHSGTAQAGITATLGNEEEDHWEWHLFDTVKGGITSATRMLWKPWSRMLPGRFMSWNIWAFRSAAPRKARLPNAISEAILRIMERSP